MPRKSNSRVGKGCKRRRRKAEGSKEARAKRREELIDSLPDNILCIYCGKKLQTIDKNDLDTYMTVEHILPLAEGGSNDMSNLAPSCKKCNDTRGTELSRKLNEMAEEQSEDS